ncbi:hypothetical protein R6Q57_016007 [Mikania cordata]
MISIQFREKRGAVNTSYDELISKSDLAHEFPSVPVQLTVDPVVSNISDDSEICEEKLSVTCSDKKEEERSAGRSTNCSTTSCSSYFVPKTIFLGKNDEIKIRLNEMLKHFKKSFSKNCAPKLNSSTLTNQATVAHSTGTKETGSQLNPNCEPYVTSTSLEQVSTSSSSGQGNCDLKPFDPIEFHQKVYCYACGKPGHIALHCLHRPTEFFYGKNQKVTPKAKFINKPVRIDQSSKPRVLPQKVTQTTFTAKWVK